MVVVVADASHGAWWKLAPGGGVGGAGLEGAGVIIDMMTGVFWFRGGRTHQGAHIHTRYGSYKLATVQY